jgi:hypothetical protein
MTRLYTIAFMLSVLLLTFATITIAFTSPLRAPLPVYGQGGSLVTIPNTGATYAVSIIPGLLRGVVLFITILLQLQSLLVLPSRGLTTMQDSLIQ